MTGSTISSTSAAITSPPASIAPPEPRPSRPGPRSPAWPLGHRRSIGVRVAGLTCLVATRANQVDGARSRAVDIGNELEAAKNLVGHANFAAWVEAELPSWGIRQAENFMRAARVFRTNPQLISHLSDTVVTALAYAPNEVCRDLLRRSEGGTRLTVAMVRKDWSFEFAGRSCASGPCLIAAVTAPGGRRT